MSTWQRGKKLNNSKYTIERELGKGGFGITYLAKDSTGTEVVIKTLNADVQKRPDFNEFQKRFLDEAKLLRECQHKNIVKFYDLFLEGQLWCIVMEYIKGENLADVVRKKGVLSLSDALEYIRQIGDALAYTHSKNLLHRDVKPENIILKNPLEVVLIDFGIAREFTPNQTNSLTPFLSDAYAPIEQYYRRHTPGNYTDVYALAATLYVLLTGYIQGGYNHQLPRAIDRDDFIKNLKNDPLIPPNQLNKDISNWLNLAILKGLKIHPKNRPQTVEEWLELLQPNLTISQKLQLSGTGAKLLSKTAVTNFIQNPSISQIPTQCFVGLKSLSQAGVTNLKRRQIKPFFIPIICLCVTVIYCYSPYLTFGGNHDYPPEDSRSPESSPPEIKSSPTPIGKETPPSSKPQEPKKTSETTEQTLDVYYLPLQNLLASQKFKEADQETIRVMLLIAEREKEGWLDVKNVENFPCNDLRKINQLWVQHSDGHFGFSIQKQVWVNVGGKTGIYDIVVADRFIERVGWGDKRYKSITYKLSAPSGHLPFEVTSRVWQLGVPYLAKRLESCNISE